MTRTELEHLVRAAADIACDDEIVVIGSQAILGQFPDAPPSMRVSQEADLYPRNHPERADLIDGSIGELSPFHKAYGYYAQGVGPETAPLPQGWQSRLIVVDDENTRGAKALCLEIHDLLAAIAGRDKDVEFLEQAARHSLADGATVLARLDTVATEAAIRDRARETVRRAFRV